MIALSIFRQLATFRPVGFLGQNSEKMGSIRCHNSWETSQIVPSGWRRDFRRAMTQTPVAVTRNGVLATSPFVEKVFQRFSDSFLGDSPTLCSLLGEGFASEPALCGENDKIDPLIPPS